MMQRESIEEIVNKEFKEFKELNILATEMVFESPAGLCKTCDRADRCRIPERQCGTWHCKDFE